MHPIILLIVSLWNEIKKTVAAICNACCAVWSELKNVEITIKYTAATEEKVEATSIDAVAPDN